MHLSKLKIKGFKSFADAVELDLSEGISAIVGPNGSGKSNITDAIRWVLGEQSIKTLRGKKMEDVIFAGTEQKAPLGYAEVILILDNSDGSLKDYPEELHVMRRLFRTGESEYRLNNQNCKLRDIQQIFTDTGLGKNGYSLISQGAIEDIINSSPMELRSIVEEAVGIVNYKTRKIDAERKLERTRENMARVEDIYDELEKRRVPLKRQAQKAKEFIAIHDSLKMIDLLRFTERVDAIETERHEYEGQARNIEAVIDQLQQQLNDCDALYQEKQIALQDLSTIIEEKTIANQNLESDLSDSKGSFLVAEERLRHLENDEQRLISEQDRMRQSLAAKETERIKNEADVSHVREELIGLRAEMNALIQKKAIMQQQAEAAQLRMNERSEREALAAEKRRRINDAIQKEREWLSGAEVRTNLADEEKARMEKEWRDRLTLSEKNQESAVILREALENGRNRLQELREAKAVLEQSLRLNEQQLNVLKNNMRVNLRQRDYLKGIQEKYSDYYPVIQKVMTAPVFQEAERRRIYGPIGELIAVPEIYARAIDVALGGKTQHIVVENIATASRCIDFLKKQQAGRATFLPLDNLHYHTVDGHDRSLLTRMTGFVGVASELIDYEPRCRSAVESLLARTLVVQDFQTAKNISRSIKRYTIVTLEGEIFQVGGAIVGGTNKGGKQSPFFKKIEIDRLTAEYQKAEKQCLVLENSCRNEQNQIAVLDDDLAKENAAVKAREQQLWRQSQEQKSVELQIAELQNRLTKLQNSRDERLAEHQTHADRLAELQQCLSEMDREVVEESEKMSTQAFAERQTALEGQLTDCKIREAQKKEQLRGMSEALQKFEKDLSNDRTALARMIREKDDKSAEKTQLIREIAQQKESVEVKTIAQKTLQAELCILTADQEKMRQTLMSLTQKIQDDNHEMMVQNDAKNKITLLMDRLETEKDHLEEGIYARYELNYLMSKDEIKAAGTLPEDYSETQQRSLRRQLNALGQVNLSAVEEYAEVEERCTFLKGQIDDLHEAEDELKDIIQALYLSMEHQFAAGFEKLQGIFSEVFTVLFEGGQAQLSYTDPAHIMESGIELTAQPPGKRLKHISLLSGGETSMTAIALLFAFLRLNPSPFCVIDEIDAALDDGNIQRFTRYMRGLAEEIQFMLITHRKKTLEVCDAIYGVTMSKTGVSKLLSIRLSDYVEEN